MYKTLLGAAGLVGAGAASGAMASSSYFARRIVTPEPLDDDVVVRDLDDTTITLDADDQTRASGVFGLWFDRFETHLRMGDVVSEREGVVVRALEGIDFGTPRPGPARFSSCYYAGPPATSFPLDLEDVTYEGPLGSMPAWQVPGQAEGRWAVLVHGRGAIRAECLRAVPTLHELGYTCLIPGYRNDLDAPPSPDRRYHLGLTEWEDIESAMVYAVEHGAQEIVLVGWSMGGAVVLQTLDRSWLSSRVSKVVLDGPVVDWGDVFAFHAQEHRLPAPLGRLGQQLMREPWPRQIVGLGTQIDLRRTDWVARARELRVPMLLIHSRDDDFVPVRQSRRLAALRPDLVTMPQWGAARHCREWNLDPERWEQQVRRFCALDA